MKLSVKQSVMAAMAGSLAFGSLAFGAMVSPALASSMPKADLKGLNSVTLGSAPSLATEFSLSPEWALGAAVSMPVLYGVNGNSFLRYEAHSSYTLLEADALTVRGLIGVFGDYDILQRGGEDLNELSPFGVQAGIAVAYQINQWVAARINFVPGMAFPYSTKYGLFAPAGGAEVSFRPFEAFEATLGLNGNGDILALRYLF